MRAALFVLALVTAVAAAWKARSGAGAALAAFGGAFAAALGVTAVLTLAKPWVACVLLHFMAMTVAKTLALGRCPPGSVTFARGVAFLLLSPTLDAKRAFVPDPSVDRGAGALHMAGGLVEMLAAFALSAAGKRFGILDDGSDFAPWPASWVRAASLLLLLDGFGRTFAGFARSLGTASEDAFDKPWLAADLADFWGARWNKFIGRTLFFDVYKPWARRLAPWIASLMAFAVSGLLHEVLYVLPAGGPAGRYLVFFGLQGIGVLVSSRLPRGRVRRTFLWLVVLATTPVFFGGAYPEALPLERLFTRP